MPDLLPALLAFAAAAVAGAVNALVGSGTLVTFPTLLAFGVSPVTANITSALGLLGGNLTAIAGYRAAIQQVRELLPKLLPWSAGGGLLGAVLLLVLPEDVFSAVVPVLVLIAIVLVLIGPLVSRRVKNTDPEAHLSVPMPVLAGLVGLTGLYGGYFGAAQGVLIIGLLGVLSTLAMVQINAIKVVLVLAVRLIAAAVFLIAGGAHIAWWYLLIMFVGSAFGGYAGARLGSTLPDAVVRAVVVVVGLVALVMVLR